MQPQGRYGAVAVVGISTQLPSGLVSKDNLDHHEFFQFLLNKGESYERIPEDRFDVSAWKGRGLGQIVTETGSFLKNLPDFDHVEFGVNAKDARAMAVSTRKLLELSFLALLDSGIDYRGRNVGCYMSGVAFDILGLSNQEEMEAKGSFAGSPCMIANRVSYHLDLVGPSIPIDTACSSTLTAMHMAVQALRAGDCESAIVGGCQLNHRIVDWLQYSQGGILSPDGKCKPFDVSANGFGRAEGAAVFVVKPLEAAIRDNDHIYCTILGTGVNSAGSAAPVSAPVATAQEDAMKRAFAMANRDPRDVDFVECHATGTASGDPTEAGWVARNFSREEELLIGSVKGNVGHLEITAFLASLSKVCSMFKTGIIPPNVNLNKLNPAIQWDKYNLRVPTEPTQLLCRSPTKRHLVAMASSGIGGVNGHAHDHLAPVLLMATGLSPRATSAMSESLADVIKGSTELSAISTVYGRRSRQMTWRSFAIGTSSGTPRFSAPVLAPRVKGPVVFVFSGQGPQNLHMGRELFDTYPVFKQSILEMDAVFKNATGESFIDTWGLFGFCANPRPISEPWPVSLTLPALTVVQIALFDLLTSFGLKPDIVLGHSAGETALIYGSGAGSKEMAVEISVARAKAMTIAQSAGGSMAALACGPDAALSIIEEVRASTEGILDIACYNSHNAVALSGAVAPVEAAVKLAKSRGFLAARLKTGAPVHSASMDICETEFKEAVGEVFNRYPGKHSPIISTWSTVNASPFDQDFTNQYYWDGTRSPVHFTSTIEALVAFHPNASFVELSPHPVLSGYLESLGASSVACPMKRPKVPEAYFERRALLDALGRFACLGHNSIDFAKLNGTTGHDLEVTLPKYPFAYKNVPFWVESSEIIVKQFRNHLGPINYPGMRISALTHPALAEHIIQGEPIMPAAGFLEIALEAGARSMWDVEFISMLSLSGDRPARTKFDLDGSFWTVKSASMAQMQQGSRGKLDRLHAQGHLSTTTVEPVGEKLDLAAIRARCEPYNTSGFYQHLQHFANYGPTYQRVDSIHLRDGEALVEVRGSDTDLPEATDFKLHPAVLDACLHAMVHSAMTGNADKGVYYLPSKVAHVTVHDLLVSEPLPNRICSHIVLKHWAPHAITYDFVASDLEGRPLITLLGFEVARHGALSTPIDARFNLITEPSQIVIPKIATPEPEPLRHVTNILNSLDLGGINGAFSAHILSSRGDNKTLVEPERKRVPSFEYVRGMEMHLQKEFSTFDVSQPLACWMVARSGPDGDAALGFTRCFRKEYLSWDVRVVVYDNSLTLEQVQNEAIPYLSTLDNVEEELYLDCTGRIHLPRLSPLPSPTNLRPFNAKEPWCLKDGSVVHCSVPLLENELVLVQISQRSHVDSSISAFIGTVFDAGETTLKAEQVVIGLTSGPVASHISVHHGSLVVLASSDPGSQERILSHALGYVVAVLALGVSSLREQSRLRKSKILFTDTNSSVAQTILSTLRSLGAQVETVSATPTVQELSRIKRITFTHAISCLPEITQDITARNRLGHKGLLYSLNDPQRGLISTLERDPWVIGDALRLAAELDLPLAVTPGFEMTSLLTASAEVPIPSVASLFDANKAYLLVGGIGSLGVRIALWMYENGARHITLTSRSGRKSLVAGDVTAIRIANYLETLPDLDIRFEASDATSTDLTAALLKTISRPLGGVMQLSGILIDLSFARQSKETFAKVYASKTRVMEVMEEVLDIPSLDFFIAFSSTSGTIGSGGQTNYGGANTALDAMTRKYKNAFSLIAPPITDSAFITSDPSLLRHLLPWSISSRKLCDCIGDGIAMLRDGPFWIYVPDLQWNVIKKHVGANHFMNHLLTDETVGAGANAEEGTTMRDVIIDLLDVDQNDFNANVPFTTYGLDSLSAGKLAFALKAFVSVTQLQLLGDMTLFDLEQRAEAQTGSAE